MRKKVLGLTALLCVPVLLASCDAGNGTEQQNNTSYYELTYYDESDDNIKYNRELFYENENINIGADPSVVYGRGSDGKDHFYVYPTGSQYRYYAYQSDDMANWTGVGDVFIPEADCWRGGNMWAPDVMYDPDVDDGLGGKGLYYMFFTA
ncbi:MAG: hypothetical protein MJ072_06605, partial [Clostridia bacterium]|nr:hypothetical protein [Clostridia bacterium]